MCAPFLFVLSIRFRISQNIQTKIQFRHPNPVILNYIITFEQLGAEAAAGELDLFGQVDFLSPREQRDLAHLRQVHADRIVDAA